MAKTMIKICALTVDSADYETSTERTFREAWSLGGNPNTPMCNMGDCWFL